ncbi:ABC-three component system middle component 2 [Shewanella sp. SM96]|uniref:ABC-three component system middle component 2 n=1 Tax=Shewanella sp. SM96 TaxID=2912813 RepID=UPI0021DA972F|nr:ABC-three component system middle component 2 [Shewanella sp. SM96]MCU8005846.1 hypothetical protein [Shewanella sp. SM96]
MKNTAELACAFIDSLTNRYIQELNQRAQWTVTMYNDYGDRLFSEIFNSAFDRWRNEFQMAEMAITKNG